MTESVVADPEVRIRRRLRIAGVVQGVGFRPFVHRLASEMCLGGKVGNDVEGVFVEVEGPIRSVSTFQRRLLSEAPPLARIVDMRVEDTASLDERTFRIVESRQSGAAATFVSPDISVCADCLAELADPNDRRYRYPFINCTNCGPRFTITIRLPYDRPNTTMSAFEMCAECSGEYHHPADRRFHAQPVACAKCGPRIWFEDASGRTDGTDPTLLAAQKSISSGGIVAIKGLGGYHLACDATSDAAIATLRARKHRPAKALAVMVPDVDAARELTDVSAAEEALLTSPQRPIVLLRQRSHTCLSSLVAPANPLIGILLPYTPLHHLLFAAVPGATRGLRVPLIMTSGNLSEEPICFDDADARSRLASIPDGWLFHDRPIHVPCDDSVLRLAADIEIPIRRSRGFAPLPVRLPFRVEPTLAVGGELKNTFCLGKGEDAWLSQHIGDMGSVETLSAFERSVKQFSDIYSVTPTAVAADPHPGYHTHQWAEANAGVAPLLVQHHHAHVAAVMAENSVAPGRRVIGFAFDGTGFGNDRAVWGGEALIAGYDSAERMAHLRYVPLAGGDAAIKKPYRVALSHLRAAGIDWDEDLYPVRAASPAERKALARQLERGFQCVATSSMGRLFDAVSALIGVRQIVTYEAQAAMELEAIATAAGLVTTSYDIILDEGVIDPGPMLRSIIEDVRARKPVAELARRFHRSIADLVVSLSTLGRDRTGIQTVALTGGVFQNALLLTMTVNRLIDNNFEVLTHRIAPPNDGGIALGQLAVAGRLT